MRHIELYTDGACSANPGPGGCAYIAVEDGRQIMRGSLGFRRTTNNRMEIKAATKGLQALRFKHIEGHGETDIKVTVKSDSQLVVSTMEKGWDKKSNKDLWEELDDTLEAFPPSIEIRFEKVKGHSGDFWNEEVDKMAVAAYATPETNPETDTGYERISPAKNGHRSEGIRREDDPVVTEVTLKGIDKPGDREALITLSNGTVIKVTGYQGGFIQSGGIHKEFMATVDIASRLAKWLNGGEL